MLSHILQMENKHHQYNSKFSWTLLCFSQWLITRAPINADREHWVLFLPSNSSSSHMTLSYLLLSWNMNVMLAPLWEMYTVFWLTVNIIHPPPQSSACWTVQWRVISLQPWPASSRSVLPWRISSRSLCRCFVKRDACSRRKKIFSYFLFY